MGNEHSRNSSSRSHNTPIISGVELNITRNQATSRHDFLIPANMDEIPRTVEQSEKSRENSDDEESTGSDTSTVSSEKVDSKVEKDEDSSAAGIIDKLANTELKNCATDSEESRETEKLITVDSSCPVSDSTEVEVKHDNTGENADDHSAELVGLFFDFGSAEPLPPAPPIISVTTSETPLPENVSDDHQSEVGNLVDKQDGKEAEYLTGYREYEDDDRDSVITNSYLDEICDNGGSQTVKYFSPRDVHNEKVIGEGGFGRVLKGSLNGGTPVAIKLFHAPLTITGELEQLLTLKHQNLATVYGVVNPTEELDCPQLVLQYFSEGNVLQFLSRHENPEDNSTLGKIALDVIEGCQHLQSRGIVHGNLAARNILIERIVGRHKTYYNAKISDIGIIRFAEASGGNYMKIPGSDRIVPVRWVPKEIVEEQEDGSIGTDFTFSSDVWSFGVILWELHTFGALPFGASYSNLRVIQFLKDGYSPLKVHRPTECPIKIASVMESIFQEDPNKRPTFDELHEHFKKYRGYGKEHNKPKTGGSSSPRAQSRGLPPTSPTLPNEVDGTNESAQQSSKDEKNALGKKKKNKKNKKFSQGKPGGDISASSASERTRAVSGGASAEVNEVDGAGALPESQKPHHHKAPQRENSTDSTIAALLKRVNQLEKDRRGGGSGGGSFKHTNWQKRSGPPRFHRGGRGGYHEGDYSRDRDRGGASVQVLRSPGSPPAPPPSSQAPPPYSEDPLPHHSSSRFSAPLPEYEYGHNPGGSRGGSRGGYPGTNSSPRDRAVVLERTGSSAGSSEEDFIRKIKRLAEEIEFLRAEKMTQELLKKSAELADIMKVVTSERSESAGVVDSGYPTSSRATMPISPRGRGDQVPGRGDQYYSHEYDDHDYNGDIGGGGRWPRQNHRDYHPPPPHPRNSQQQSRSGSGQQRRPYFKGRGGGGSHRGNYNNGRYNDGDGGGSYYGN